MFRDKLNILISISGLKSKIVTIVFPNFSRKNKRLYLLYINRNKIGLNSMLSSGILELSSSISSFYG